jgi:hypothetical protein
LQVSMDGTGSLNVGMDQISKTMGTLFVSIAKTAPYRAVESLFRNAEQAGVHNIFIVSGPYVLYQGRPYYQGLDTSSFRVYISSTLANLGNPVHLNYAIYINEAGQAVGLQRFYPGDESPEFEKAVMGYRGEPALINGEPVPSAVFFRVDRN